MEAERVCVTGNIESKGQKMFYGLILHHLLRVIDIGGEGEGKKTIEGLS